MKYSSLLFVTVIAVTVSYTQAVSKATDEKRVIGEAISDTDFSDGKLSLSSETQKQAEHKSPRKPKKSKKKSHAYNKKRGKRK